MPTTIPGNMLGNMDRVQSGLAASTSARTLPPRPALSSIRWGGRSSRANDIVCGGLKKETKKLAKTLKAHRKRLESLLTAAAADSSTMQLVLLEINQLQSAVEGIRSIQQQQKRLARSGSSSDSDSDSEDEATSSRQMGGYSRPSRPSMVVAAGSMCMQLEAPAIDQEQPGIITQQLPPPQQYNAGGRILVCQGKACMAKGGLQVLQAASHAAAGSPGIEVLPCKCLGKCKQGPAVRMRSEQPGCTLLTQVNPLEVPDAVDHVFGAQQPSAEAAVAVDTLFAQGQRMAGLV